MKRKRLHHKSTILYTSFCDRRSSRSFVQPPQSISEFILISYPCSRALPFLSPTAKDDDMTMVRNDCALSLFPSLPIVFPPPCSFLLPPPSKPLSRTSSAQEERGEEKKKGKERREKMGEWGGRGERKRRKKTWSMESKKKSEENRRNQEEETEETWQLTVDT